MKLIKVIEKIFFPQKCAVCGKLLKINEEDCLCCGSEEQRLPTDCCIHCGSVKEECCCQSSVTAPLPHITGAYHYAGLIRNKLLNYKFAGRTQLYKFFGDVVSERVAVVFAKTDFDVVTFVPSSEKALRDKDANHCRLISERVSKKLFTDHEELLVKIKDTPKQHRLTAKERMTNVKGSVAVKKNAHIKGRTVLLCDDIKTTGATLKECTDVLLAAGAKDVYCATVAVAGNLTPDREL